MAADAGASNMNAEARHACPCTLQSIAARLRQVTTVQLGHVPVAGDGHCLFHALGYLDRRDGAALRNEVAAFMVDEACNQPGFEEAWLEEADELLQGTWGGHTAITAYSLMKQVRVEMHTIHADGTGSVMDTSHAKMASNMNAPLRRILYSNGNHYDALVELLPNPQGWTPAWEQPMPIIYFKEIEKPGPKPQEFPPLATAAGSGNPKRPRLNAPRPTGKQATKSKKKKGTEGAPDITPKKAPNMPSQYPVLRRCVRKTTLPPELRDDILTELCRIPVKPRMAHPHQKLEDLIKDQGCKWFYSTF